MTRGIQNIFCEVPGTYETVNHVLTLGMDILWRRRAVSRAVRGGGDRWLDMCTGTGETAVYLRRAAGRDGIVVACDFCLPMARPLAKKPEGAAILLTLGDASRLPFADGSFDLVTMSFATRNLNVTRDHLLRCFREYHRVLRPGGRFVNLETSQPRSRVIRTLFHRYVALTVRPLGTLISGSGAAYNYLSYTIPRFYPPEELASILRTAGFDRVTWTRLLFGAAAIHEATKGSFGEDEKTITENTEGVDPLGRHTAVCLPRDTPGLLSKWSASIPAILATPGEHPRETFSPGCGAGFSPGPAKDLISLCPP